MMCVCVCVVAHYSYFGIIYSFHESISKKASLIPRVLSKLQRNDHGLNAGYGKCNDHHHHREEPPGNDGRQRQLTRAEASNRSRSQKEKRKKEKRNETQDPQNGTTPPRRGRVPGSGIASAATIRGSGTAGGRQMTGAPGQYNRRKQPHTTMH